MAGSGHVSESGAPASSPSGADDRTDPGAADALAKTIAKAAKKGPAPVHLWNPPYCGDLDIRIRRDGSWWYLGTPIGREALVKLFASVLKLEDGRHYLVTPVEKIGITVDDAPFVAVDFRVSHAVAGDGAPQEEAPQEGTQEGTQVLTFVTNVGDESEAGPENPIRVTRDPETGEPSPYIHIRRGLEALIDRKSFYRLVEIGEVEPRDGIRWFGLRSNGVFFPIIEAAALEM